jgi:hypothetical protein
METSWLTYREAADALGLPSPAAAKLRAKRGRRPKRQGNDGLVRVQVPEGTTPYRPHIDPVSPKADDPVSIPDRPRFDLALQALRDQLTAAVERETRLVSQLAAAEARADKQAAELVDERAKTEKAVAEFAALVDRLTTLADEKAKTDKAIAAFADLANRLDQLAAERDRRRWWRRLVG